MKYVRFFYKLLIIPNSSFLQCDARHQHMFQQLANALNLEVSAVEDFLFGDERVGV